MGGVSRTHGRDEKCIQNAGQKTWKEETTWKNLGVDGRIILELIFGKQGGKVRTRCIWLRIGTSGGLF
jgi:hypothetical protein